MQQRGRSHFFILCVTLQTAVLDKLKLKNDGRSPLNLRRPLEADKVTEDVYFDVAPGQSTLGYSSSINGVKPAHLA